MRPGTFAETVASSSPYSVPTTLTSRCTGATRDDARETVTGSAAGVDRFASALFSHAGPMIITAASSGARHNTGSFIALTVAQHRRQFRGSHTGRMQLRRTSFVLLIALAASCAVNQE